ILNNQLWILFWAQAEKLVQFLFILLNTLSLLVRPPIVNRHILNVNQTCFETLTKIVQRDLLAGLIDTHGRNHLRLSLYSLSIRSNPDLPSLSLSSEDEMALSANGVTSFEKPMGETSQGVVKDRLFNRNLPTTKSKQII
ncbi:unnamed protein product, partial [Rotaria sp. Silwood2]